MALVASPSSSSASPFSSSSRPHRRTASSSSLSYHHHNHHHQHRHTESVPEQHPPSSPALRFMSSMRRSLLGSPVPKPRAASSSSATGMISTPAENSPPRLHRPHVPAAAPPPTIEQIAMGLHVSRTPHIRPSSASGPHVPGPRLPPRLPPPPLRSSLKPQRSATLPLPIPPRPASAGAASDSTLASARSPSDHSSSTSSFKKLRFFERLRSSASSSVSSADSPRNGLVDLPLLAPQRKAVRFSSTPHLTSLLPDQHPIDLDTKSELDA